MKKRTFLPGGDVSKPAEAGSEIELFVELHLHDISFHKFQLRRAFELRQVSLGLLDHPGAEVKAHDFLAANPVQKLHTRARPTTDIQRNVGLSDGAYGKLQQLVGRAKGRRIEPWREEIIPSPCRRERLLNQLKKRRAAFGKHWQRA